MTDTQALARIRKGMVRRHAVNVPTRVPMVYIDRQGVLQYATAWQRRDGEYADMPPVQIASRAQKGIVNSAPYAGLDCYAERDYVTFTTDPELVALHPLACNCPGGASAGHDAHLKIIKANRSRNAWCITRGAEYKRVASDKRADGSQDRTADRAEDLSRDDTARRTVGGLDKRARVIAAAKRMQAQKVPARDIAAYCARHGVQVTITRRSA